MSPRLLLVAAVVALVACDAGDTITPPPTSGLPLIAATYYLHEADGDTLPALISTRIAGVSQEKTFLDSARIIIAADSTYEQRYWVHILLNEVPDRSEFVIDIGTYKVEGFGFRLTSELREREFTMVVPRLGNITSFEQMLYFANEPPITTGLYKVTPP